MIVVTSYDVFWRVIAENVPLDQVQGMAYGVREDAISGKRLGIVGNQCAGRVGYWEIKKI